MEPEKDAYVPFLSYTCTAEDKASAREQDPMSAGERMTAAYAVLFDHPEIVETPPSRVIEDIR